MARSRMYAGVETWNIFVGCKHDCTYCRPSFQNPLKRWAKANCRDCYDYRPHFHPERMKKIPKKANLIFVAACGDLAFATADVVETILARIRHVRRTFLIQTKNPIAFYYVDFPPNVIFGTTLETNRSMAKYSRAPPPESRAKALASHKHGRKFITVEPIVDFDLDELVGLIYDVRPERVWVGYENYGVGLPEPPLEKTLELIDRLEDFTLVGRKTLREPIS